MRFFYVLFCEGTKSSKCAFNTTAHLSLDRLRPFQVPTSRVWLVATVLGQNM